MSGTEERRDEARRIVLADKAIMQRELAGEPEPKGWLESAAAEEEEIESEVEK